jgi:hypothetical protein
LLFEQDIIVLLGYPHKNTEHKTWATFTYDRQEIKTTTKLFKDKNINIAYKTCNTIEHILLPKTPKKIENIFYNSSIYQLNCLVCPKKYIAQTDHTFKIRFKEHIHAIHSK